jgi:hypothetical protein
MPGQPQYESPRGDPQPAAGAQRTLSLGPSALSALVSTQVGDIISRKAAKSQRKAGFYSQRQKAMKNSRGLDLRGDPVGRLFRRGSWLISLRLGGFARDAFSGDV